MNHDHVLDDSLKATRQRLEWLSEAYPNDRGVPEPVAQAMADVESDADEQPLEVLLKKGEVYRTADRWITVVTPRND